MASKGTRSRRCGKKKIKEQPKMVGEVSVPASELTKKSVSKRKLNDDNDNSLVRNRTSKPKPETNLNESTSSEPVKKRALKAINKKERENLREYLNVPSQIKVLENVRSRCHKVSVENPLEW